MATLVKQVMGSPGEQNYYSTGQL